MSEEKLRIRLVFADQGSFHDEVVELAAETLARYDRLVDALREEPEVTASVYVDYRRLVAAYRLDGPGEGDDVD